MPEIGTMQQINSEPLRTATVLTPQSQAEQYAREAQQAAAEAAQSATDAQTAAESAEQAAAGAVKYSEAQTLTTAQQAQARANIGAGDAEEVADLKSTTGDLTDLETQDKSSLVAAINEAAQSGGDTDALAPVIHDTASGAVTSFTDGADDRPIKSLVVNIEPVQDLHGYDHPWPAGGGVNRFDGALESGSINGTTGEATSNPSFSRSVNFIAVLSNTAYYVYGSEITTTSEVFVFAYQDDGTYISYQKLESNGAYTTPSNCAKVRLQVRRAIETVTNYLYAFNYPNTVTTYSPYSNICPITGWTEAKLTRAGVNVLNLSEWESESNSGITIGTDDISITNKGYQEALNRYYILNRSACVFSFHVKTVALNDSRASFAVYADWTTKLPGSGTTGIGNIMLDSVGAEKDITLTVPNGTEYISFGGWAWGGEVQISNLQLALGSTATSYKPYSGQKYDITFPTEAGTVYGGTLTLNSDGSGELVVDMAMAKVSDLTVNGGLNVGTYTVMRRFFLPSLANAVSYSQKHGAIGSMGVEAAAYYGSNRTSDAGSTNVNFGITASGDLLAIYDTDLTLTSDAFMAKYGDAVIVYPLATPITYTLTASQIRTLLGQNNIWADAGPISVEYTADTKMYIDSQTRATRSLIAGIETTMTASRPYAAGDLLIVGDTLYKAAASIASGATLTPGTNVTPTTVAEQLILLANA